MESKSKEDQAESAKLHRKVLDLESRSMRDNLVFHSLPETTPENCELLVKALLKEELGMGEFETHEIIFDQIHRIGRKENQRPGIYNLSWLNFTDIVKESKFASLVMLSETP